MIRAFKMFFKIIGYVFIYTFAFVIALILLPFYGIPVYFIGAGGIGMSALVRYFLSKGKKVGGYDRTPSELTEKLIDCLLYTSFEEPQEIINDMLAGLTKEDMRKVISIADRKEAIRTACMLAQAKDVILVAGKGHELSLIHI